MYKHLFCTDKAVEQLKSENMTISMKLHKLDRKRGKSWKEMRLSIPRNIRNIKTKQFI